MIPFFVLKISHHRMISHDKKKLWSHYEACIKRVEADTTGEAHCTGQYLDFWACIDKCVRYFPNKQTNISQLVKPFLSFSNFFIYSFFLSFSGCTQSVCITQVTYFFDNVIKNIYPKSFCPSINVSAMAMY